MINDRGTGDSHGRGKESVLNFWNMSSNIPPEEPQVSIVTPAYNEEQFIGSLIESVISQDYNNIEHIIIDDGSTDNTPEILKDYENEYNLRWFSKENAGQAKAVNDGFDRAQGEIVLWLNADDALFSTNSIPLIVNKFLENPDLDVLYSIQGIMDENNNLIRFENPLPKFYYNRLIRSYFGSFIFFRSDVIKKHKVNPEYEYALDYEYILRIAGNEYDFDYLNKPTWVFRHHNDQKSSTLSSTQKEEGKMAVSKHSRKNNSTSIGHYTDFAQKVGMRLYGVKDVINLDDCQFAFDLQVDSKIRLLKRQLSDI